MVVSTVGSKSKGSSLEPRKELLASVDALAHRGGISRDRAITAWYASMLLGIDEDDAIDASSVDGPEDCGCDFIYVDDDQETIYVLQVYVSDRSDKGTSIKKWHALVAAVSNLRDPISFKHAGRMDIYERLLDEDVENYSLVFGLVTLALKSDQIARQHETVVRSKTYGAAVSFFMSIRKHFTINIWLQRLQHEMFLKIQLLLTEVLLISKVNLVLLWWGRFMRASWLDFTRSIKIDCLRGMLGFLLDRGRVV